MIFARFLIALVVSVKGSVLDRLRFSIAFIFFNESPVMLPSYLSSYIIQISVSEQTQHYTTNYIYEVMEKFMPSLADTAPSVEMHYYNAMMVSMDLLTESVKTRKMERSPFGKGIISSIEEFKQEMTRELPDTKEIKLPLPEYRVIQSVNYMRYCTRELQEAHNSLVNMDWKFWCDQGQYGTYGHKTKEEKDLLTFDIQARLGGEILLLFNQTIDVMDDFIPYIHSIKDMYKKNSFNMTSDCEVSKLLQKEGISRKLSNKFCFELGVALVTNLPVVQLADIWKMEITNKEKGTLQLAFQTILSSLDKSSRTLRGTRVNSQIPEKQYVVEMRALLEAL